MMYNGRPVDLTKIRRTALLTIEGENDDISGVGQTEAAQQLCINIPGEMRIHYVQPKVGHYGVFNGSRFRAEICPRIIDFALTHGTSHAQAKLPKRPETVSGDSTYRKFGAYAERDAKAKTLGRGRASAGETVLAGAVVPDPSRAMRAMNDTAEAMMKTAFGKAKPLGARLSENPADDRDPEVSAKTPTPPAPAAATPTASVQANAPVSEETRGPGQSRASETVANSNVKRTPGPGPKAAALETSSPTKATGSAARAESPAAKSGANPQAPSARASTAQKTAAAAGSSKTASKAASRGKADGAGKSTFAAKAKPAVKGASQSNKASAEVVTLKPATEPKTAEAATTTTKRATKPAAGAAAETVSQGPKSESGPSHSPAAIKPDAPSGKALRDAASSSKPGDAIPTDAKAVAEPERPRPPETKKAAETVATAPGSTWQVRRRTRSDQGGAAGSADVGFRCGEKCGNWSVQHLATAGSSCRRHQGCGTGGREGGDRHRRSTTSWPA